MSQINDVDGRASREAGEFETGFSSPNGRYDGWVAKPATCMIRVFMHVGY